MATAAKATKKKARGARRETVQAEVTTRGKGLTPERIFEAAKAIADQDGLDALTIRRLASDLDVSPTAIYWHVRTREELLRGVHDITLKTVEVNVDTHEDWRERVAAVCRAERNMMVAHPFMFALAQQFPGRGATRTLNVMMSAARDAGYDSEEALQIARLFGTYAIGFGFVQTASESQPTVGSDLQDFLDENGTELLEVVPHLLTPVTDELFELGLTWLINGVPEPRVASAP
jgi:AcrR family transcriptional regulator